MKKLAVIGAGTAGTLTALHYSYYAKEYGYELEWYYDPNTKPQAVGEGTTGDVVDYLKKYANFTWDDMIAVDGNFKTGVRKINWTSEGSDFNHIFPPPLSSMHFNAVKLQAFMRKRIIEMYPETTIIEKNISHDDLDADYIIDCTGRPTEVQETPYIYLNAVHVTQCYWDSPKFYDTLAIARPYGWVFAIPLKNRCSIGYMYNSKFNNIDEVKDDVKIIFEDLGLKPSVDTNSFEFTNYFNLTNYTDRVAYNGNASFFLEPMEATSISTIMQINFITDAWLFKKLIDRDQANSFYRFLLLSMQNLINLHYINGSKFNTKFWSYAKEKSQECIHIAIQHDDRFRDFLAAGLTNKQHLADSLREGYYGVWPESSFVLNIKGLKLEEFVEGALEMYKKSVGAK